MQRATSGPARASIGGPQSWLDFVVSEVAAEVALLSEAEARKPGAQLRKIPAVHDSADGHRTRHAWGKAFKAEGKALDLAMKASDLVFAEDLAH